ncbi:carbohydrate-binding module family 13 protein [Hypoxylon trugodes]|uniref:carbohydrate-binding module family 13 protein n=1 Tax=Hypoxylon trugodes TaxID=326681 RepID=UPI00219B0B05|nr:carbohydrate-binding module family 13 protein [Hypoxylon trugodes]KAI1390589.1 carbohydrate-binding module family 13 protein [Hypoxylon trugodes]
MSYIDSLDGAVVCFFNYGTGTCIDLTEGKPSTPFRLASSNSLCKAIRPTPLPSLGTSTTLVKTSIGHFIESIIAPFGPHDWADLAVANMDLLNGGKADGTKINGYSGPATNNTNLHQLWRLVSADPAGRVIMIQNVGTGTYVDLLNGNSANSTQISSYSGNVEAKNEHQLWRVLRIE